MEKNDKLIVIDDGEFACYRDTAKFEHAQRVAKMLAEAQMLPKQYKNSVADCLIAFNQATLLGIDPILFMQKTYPVGGKIGIESQLAVALANKAQVFTDVIQYEFSGEPKSDAWTCRAYAETRATGVLCEEFCSVADAKDMGWWNRAGSPWPKQTKKMLRYRSAINLIRTYCPEVLFGLDSVEELRDTPPASIDITNRAMELKPSSPADAMPPLPQKEKSPAKKETGQPDEAEEKTPLNPKVRALLDATKDDALTGAIEDAKAAGLFSHDELWTAVTQNDEKAAEKYLAAIESQL